VEVKVNKDAPIDIKIEKSSDSTALGKMFRTVEHGFITLMVIRMCPSTKDGCYDLELSMEENLPVEIVEGIRHTIDQQITAMRAGVFDAGLKKS
jgi:hypothetical protein